MSHHPILGQLKRAFKSTKIELGCSSQVVSWYPEFHPQHYTRAHIQVLRPLTSNRKASQPSPRKRVQLLSLVSAPATPSLLPSLTLVTEQTSPALFAGTLPGAAAGAMTTAIVGDAFIA